MRFRSREFCAFKIGVKGVLLAALGGLSACLFPGEGGGGAPDSGGVDVEVLIHRTALSPVDGSPAAAKISAVQATDSVFVRVTAPDMPPMESGFSGAQTSISLTDLRPGEDRRFEIRLFQQGRLLYAGETTASLYTDRKNSLVLHCLPEFSALSASLHVPLDFPKTIAGGRLVMWNAFDTLSASAVAAGEIRTFRVERVPGDRAYTVSLALWGLSGDTLARGHLAFVNIPKGQSVALAMPLVTTFPQIQIAMTLADPKVVSGVLNFPAAKRAPAAFGEIVFSELYPAPSVEDSSDNGEWIELFNRMSDTLDVSGCQIVRDAGGSGMVGLLPGGTLIPPGKGLVVGRSAVSFADVHVAGAFSLVNTSARLEFNCPLLTPDFLKLDTMTYATSSTDPAAARIAPGKVTSLKPSRLVSRRASDAWCQVPLRALAAEAAATPGTLFGSCGE